MGKIITYRDDLALVERCAIDHLQRGIRVRNHPFRQMALATTTPTGPGLRTVICRKVNVNPFEVWAYTDLRSEKVASLKAQPEAALLFWHPRGRLQVVLKVRFAIHSGDDLALEAWHSAGHGGRAAYNTLLQPGTFVEGDLWKPAALREPMESTSFAVLVGSVNTMEVLQLGDEGHIRARFEYSGGVQTSSTFVVP